MNKNIMYLIGGAVGVAILILGYQYYEANRATNGVEIRVDDSGISIQKQ